MSRQIKNEPRTSPCHCINLRRANTAVTAFYDRALEPAGLTVSQYSLLANLHRLGSSSLSGLADRVGLDRSTVLRNLRPLFKIGYVEDRTEAGKRDHAICVTPAGEGALDAARPLWESAQGQIEQHIGCDEVRMLTNLLSQLETLPGKAERGQEGKLRVRSGRSGGK